MMCEKKIKIRRMSERVRILGVLLHHCHPSKLRWIVSTQESKGSVTFQKNRGVKQTTKSQPPCLRSSLRCFFTFHHPSCVKLSFSFIFAWFSPSFSLIGALLRCFFSHMLSSAGTVWLGAKEKNFLVQHLPHLGVYVLHTTCTPIKLTDKESIFPSHEKICWLSHTHVQ